MTLLETTPALLLIVAAAFLLAGFVKGIVGLGLPTVAIGVLAIAMPPGRAAAILIMPGLVTNLWQLFSGRNILAIGRRLWPLLIGVCLATSVGGGLLTGDPTGLAGSWLGIALIAYAILGLTAVRFTVSPRTETWLGPVIGLLSGFVASLTGIFVIPAVPYLGALGFEKDDLITALGLYFTVSTVALGLVLARDGAFTGSVSALSVPALLAALAGMWLGTRTRGRIGAATFRTVFFVGLLLLGLHLASRLVL